MEILILQILDVDDGTSEKAVLYQNQPSMQAYKRLWLDVSSLPHINNVKKKRKFMVKS